MTWISVDDRLPKIDDLKQYFVHFDDGYVNILSRPFEKTFGWEWVTHWMDTPEPSKGQEMCELIEIKSEKDFPPIGEEVFVCWTTGLREITTRTSYDDNRLDVGFHGDNHRRISHWMPLPESPQKGE